MKNGFVKMVMVCSVATVTMHSCHVLISFRQARDLLEIATVQAQLLSPGLF